MKNPVLTILACGMLWCGPAQAQDAAMAPAHQFINALNAGDSKTAAAAHQSSVAIIDEFAPYHWNTFDAWLRSFEASNKKYKVTDARLTLSAPTTSMVDDTFAYEVVPSTINGRMDGKPLVEKGIFTFAMVKTAGGWRIASWAWAKQ